MVIYSVPNETDLKMSVNKLNVEVEIIFIIIGAFLYLMIASAYGTLDAEIKV